MARHRLLALALAAGLSALPLDSAHAAPTSDPAAAAAGWLASRVGADGFISATSGPDRNGTALAVLAMASARVAGDATDRATTALAGAVDAYVRDANGDDRPAALGTLVQVAVATGRNPRAFGGADLVARLAATKRASGPDAGLFGAQDPAFDGAYRQAVALLALDSVGSTDADAVSWLTRQQCPDGGWQAYRADTSAPCAPTDPAGFTGEDTNSTGIAAQALAAVGVTPTTSPLGFLDSTQNADGGFGFLAGTASDANSTSLATQAILAFGEDPAAGRWADADGDTPRRALLRLQLGCGAAAADRGAFAYQPESDGSLSANVLATVQVVPALVGLPYPVPAGSSTADAPTLACAAAASPTPSTGNPLVVAPPPETGPPGVVNSDVDASGAPILPVSGGVGTAPWDTTGLAVFAFGLIGYGALALGASRWFGRARG